MKFNPIHPELVIPANFAECLTYELQIAWLKKEIDNVATGGSGESVKVLEDKVAALERSVAALTNKTNTLTTSVSDIEREINSIKTDLDNVKRNLENFATKDDITGFISESRVDEKLSAYETIEHAEATYVKKGTTGDYVTGEQLDNKLVDYATKIELQEYVTDEQLENYLTKTEADDTYAKKGEIPSDVLTKTEAASTYATKEEIPNISNLATKEELTTGLNDKVSINTFDSVVNTLATKENVEATYAKKSELPELSDYTTKSYVDTNFLAKNEFNETIQNYAEKTELGNYVTTETAEATYAKKGEIPSNVLTKTEAASTYATKEEIPNVSDLATKQELTSGLNGKVSINTFDSVVATLATKENVEATYAKKTDIPNVSDLVTDVELSQTLEEYATKSEIPEGVIVDATVSSDGQNPVKSQGIYNFVVDQTADLVTTEMLATKQDKLTFDETPTVGSSNPVKSSGIKTAIETATSDMLTKTEAASTYATKSEIPDISGYVTKTVADETYAKKGEIPTDVLTKTEAASTYATKEEIPDVSAYITKTMADETYAKKDEIPTDVLTKTEAASTYATKSEIPDVSNLVTTEMLDAYETKGSIINMNVDFICQYYGSPDLLSGKIYVEQINEPRNSFSKWYSSEISGKIQQSTAIIDLPLSTGMSDIDHIIIDFDNRTPCKSFLINNVKYEITMRNAIAINNQGEITAHLQYIPKPTKNTSFTNPALETIETSIKPWSRIIIYAEVIAYKLTTT